jgi:osmotically inducible lipoprotein OsmB
MANASIGRTFRGSTISRDDRDGTTAGTVRFPHVASNREIIMSGTIRLSAAALVALGLAACGSSTGDRAVSGGAIGAGAGAAIGGLTGGSVLGGALLGGAAGAAGGALTKDRDVNLGKPIWR